MIVISALAFELYGSGTNERGQLGLGYSVEEMQYFSRQNMFLPLDIVSIKASMGKQAFAVTADGVGYAWGDNTWGQISPDLTLKMSDEPIVMSFFSKAGVKLAMVDAD